jgi:hypothetical protein
LEAIGAFAGIDLFSNPDIQLQICSPGRLSAGRAALLAIGFYLGSDRLRRYAIADLSTNFATDRNHPVGKRLVLYDARGDFDRDFEWWSASGSKLEIRPTLPFEQGRTDILAGICSERDVINVNLLSTLLVHAQYDGYWGNAGRLFELEMYELLERHLLGGLTKAPWIRTSEKSTAADNEFYAALQELVAYAFGEAVRVRESGHLFWSRWREIPKRRGSQGILSEVQGLLRKFQREVFGNSQMLNGGH